MYLIIFFILFITTAAQGNQIKDLGSYGFVCEERIEKINIIDHRVNSPILQTKIEKINLSFNPKLKVNSELNLKTMNIPSAQDRKIFVFGVDDPNSKDAAKSIKADYGICIRYDSVNEIDAFRLETGIKFPVQLGNDEIIKFLKIDSYPTLISIEGSNKNSEKNN